jgi:hypothetical protein
MKLVISKKGLEDVGIVYVLEITLDTMTVVKIGMTNRDKVDDRVLEILLAMSKKYRYFPRCYVARFTKVDKPLDMEQKLHEHFKEYSVELEHSFGGSTEFFNVPIELVKEKYDEMVKDRKKHKN